MTEREKFERDIATLRESIRLYKMSLHEQRPKEVRGTLQAIGWCIKELADLQSRLSHLDNSN